MRPSMGVGHGRGVLRWVAVTVMLVMVSGLMTVPAAAGNMASLGALLDLERPALAAVKQELAAGDEAGAAEALKSYYANRTGIEVPTPSVGGQGDATADEIAQGVFRFEDQERDFYDETEGRIDIDWNDLWGGTEAAPGRWQVLMSDLTFMPILTRAYSTETDPVKRAAYAKAWLDISLDFFADNPEWPRARELSAAKRLSQLVSSLSVFRVEPSIEADRLVAYLSGLHATTDHLAYMLQDLFGNNWYLSLSRSIYAAAVYLPEFRTSATWEPYAVRSAERFVRLHVKEDLVYREPTVNYQAYVADLLNSMINMGDANSRQLPPIIAQTSDWIADALFATRQPDLQAALIGDAKDPGAGQVAIRRTGERNAWDDFRWVGSGGADGSRPTLGSTLYPLSFAVQRSGWDADARYMLINNQSTSYTQSHRHPDDLSLVMAAYGRPLIVDPGTGEDYAANELNDWMRYRTEAHNTVDVDRKDQAKGATRATSLWRTNAGLDLYRGHALGYRPVAHDRVVYFVKPGFWVVSDAMTGDAGTAHDYRQLWHFPGDRVAVDPVTKVATVGFGATSGVRMVPVAAGGVTMTPTIHHNGAVRVGANVLTDVAYLSYDWSSSADSGLDTVIVPGPAGSAPAVSSTRIPLDVPHATATALRISLPRATGVFYLSREASPTTRTFATTTTDGETAYLERAAGGAPTRYALTRGSSLIDGGTTFIRACGVVSDLNVELKGATAHVSLADPFVGTVSLHAPNAKVVLVNGSPVQTSRNGSLVTIAVGASPRLAPVLDERFDDASLERRVYGFESSLEGWTSVVGAWARSDGSLVQSSTAAGQSFAMQPGAPADLVASATVTPGRREQTTTATGLAFRYLDARTHYRAQLVHTDTGAALQLLKLYHGAVTVLAETPIPVDPDATQVLVVSAIGTRLTARVGDASISAVDDRLPSGGLAAHTQGTAASFDEVTVSEALDQTSWRGLSGHASVSAGTLMLDPAGTDRAHVVASSTLPRRFSEQCDFVAETTVTIHGERGQAGISLRDTADAYGYRLHVGRTGRGTSYASIIREAQRSGPLTVASTPVDHPLAGAVRLRASIVGDRITLSLNGVTILEGRDTVVRSGGVGLYASTKSTFDLLTVATNCEGRP